MNNMIATKPLNDGPLLDDALASLEAATGIASQIMMHGDDYEGDVSLHVAGIRLNYTCEIKRNIDRIAMLDDIKARSNAAKTTLLVSTPLTNAMAARCHELDLQFIDTAGNAFITNRDGILISITGRRMAKAMLAKPDKTITPAALRMMFAFLAQPSMLNAPYREISASVGVATGAIGSALQVLEARGIIGTTPAGRRIINSPDLILSEWATGYTSRLRPKLKKFRFSGPRPSEVVERWAPEMRSSAWGGEIAAEEITRHLNPSTCTIYMTLDDKSKLADMVKELKLRADPNGTIEIVQAFWNMNYFLEKFPTVPLHLIYADLLGTNDARNLLIAKKIYNEVMNHVHRAES